MTPPRIAAIIVAAGSGSRMGGLPKQYMPMAGKPVIAHSVDTLSAHPSIGRVIVVIGEAQEEMIGSALGDADYVIGGATRRESVRNGLEKLASEGGCDRVLIHDAARPVIPARVLNDLLDITTVALGAAPVLPVADTLVRIEPRENADRTLGGLGEPVDRSALLRVQTPQVFDFPALLAAHRSWPVAEEATDDAQILRRAGHAVSAAIGDPLLEKITWPGDIPLAEVRLGMTLQVRSASGFDVHRLEDGEELWLGGILIPHDKGLSGHSDADVALHAITDALLGTIAAGDIGMHFPPGDPQWHGADSARFLDHAAGLVRKAGGVIDFVDLTLICEAPRIGPYREAMRTRIAGILDIDIGQTSVKATTTERLGFTGRGEGIAAQAVATIRIPTTARICPLPRPRSRQ